MSAAPDQTDRLLAFELAGTLYALPITDVVEVAEVGPLSAVPMLPLAVGGVVNHHGDALLVLDGPTLLERPPCEARPTHLLVLARDPDDPACFGLPVDGIRVIPVDEKRAHTHRARTLQAMQTRVPLYTVHLDNPPGKGFLVTVKGATSTSRSSCEVGAFVYVGGSFRYFNTGRVWKQ